MNSKALFRMLFHVFTTFVYFCAIIRYEYLPPMPHKKPQDHFAGRLKYLTYWNLLVQFLFFTLSSIMDFMKTSSSSYNKLTKLRDKFYAGIVLPYGVFVVAMFWILYGINRELIFPKVLDPVFPPWLNHVSHTVILPVLLIETYIIKHRHPRRRDGMKLTAAFGLCYGIWTLILGLGMDIWVYPVLQIMNWTARIVFFAVSILFMFLQYLVGEKINCLFWGEGIVQKNK
ncbi:androgen-induced gene 1 protein isoform X2 [Parasteatoda tepidariorum]|nr:androgen-induced gene 1 protein isoform X2 [Parasteatoda tepidariorum]XP_015924927.1 androgen-induced gene 1 protein isoform X2 [Parasteatoda tepidariorum]XP_015924928.1 androgen-induced gene 1 protein isoform X2 [Parasteatoda tepidariorum]XP_015924929.1 androgen-induced gene 1 protein isoform X2 [Parasteatoda tepidariorum]